MSLPLFTSSKPTDTNCTAVYSYSEEQIKHAMKALDAVSKLLNENDTPDNISLLKANILYDSCLYVDLKYPLLQILLLCRENHQKFG